MYFAALYARKTHLVAAFSGSLVSTAMSGKMRNFLAPKWRPPKVGGRV